MQKPKAIIILGTTATGKSALAVKIAKKINGEIISADSRQIYKSLNIGTGKITEEEMKGVPHHLLNIANPQRKFTVAEYQKKAIYAMADIAKRNKIPIICGGTGFYIDAVTKGIVFPKVPPNEKLRKKLVTFSAIALFVTLKKLDPRRAKDIKEKNEQNNKVRLIRAIEVAKALGKVPKLSYDANSERTKNAPSYDFIKIGLYLPPNILKEKVEKRVGRMFKAGLIKEIKKLKKSGISQKRLQEFGFEYNHPTKEKVINGTLKYAKRQITWFKRDKDIRWFDASKKNFEKNIFSKLKLKKDF